LRSGGERVKGSAMELSTPEFAFPHDPAFASRAGALERVQFRGLWLAGSLAGLGGPTVAIVGPRAPSDGARARARELARYAARAGVCVISGLALGVDGAAHAGALAGGGATIGVLGSGHRRFFPRRNRALAEAMIAAGGAVVSPFAPDQPAYRSQFLQRNGLVAALADVVVIVEAAARSGALNTASWAGELGIDVLAFPGDVDRPKAAGCNALIRDGATLVRGAEDVLAELRVTPPAPAVAATASRSDPLENDILRALASGPLDFDALLESTEATPSGLAGALVRLELDGHLGRSDAATYALDLHAGNRGPA